MSRSPRLCRGSFRRISMWRPKERSWSPVVNADRQSNMVACAEHGASVFPGTKGTRAMGIFSKDIKTMDDLFVHRTFITPRSSL